MVPGSFSTQIRNQTVFRTKMATVFRKPKRNFRQRIARDDSEDENKDDAMETEDSESTGVKTIADVKKAREKKKKEKSKTVLSFDEEEGDYSFQIKKSSHSKKIAKQLKKESMLEKEAEQKNASSKKDQKKEPEENNSSKPPQTKQEKVEVENRIKKLREEFLTMNGEEAENLEAEESDEDSTFKKMLKRGQIPDATTIHQIRKQRQMARDTGDFLPLDDTVKYENSSSRLVRDDDNDKSDEDEDQRIDFSANKSAIERQKMKDDFLRAEHGSDEDDQEREWEEQQIQKGVTVMQQVPSNQDLYGYDQENTSESTNSVSNGHQGKKSSQNSGDKVYKQPDLSLKLAGKMEDLTLNVMIKKLKERLTGMEDVHRAHRLESDKLVTDLEESKATVESCESSISSLESRYRFFQEMRGYVRDLVECLNEKVPEINSLEMRMNNLLRSRMTKLINRRQQDVQDQCQAYMTSKSQVVVDTENPTRQRRTAEREARRSRRRRAREGKNIAGHHDGLSSDDEENLSEITKFKQERDEIFYRSQDLFEDVVEDFSEMDSIRQRFIDWKRKYRDTYTEAYIGICLPKLVNPFIRLQLIKWNPLDETCKDFEEMPWFESLLFYGHEDHESIDKDDDDNKIIPAIIDKVVLPKLASECWISNIPLVCLLENMGKVYDEHENIDKDDNDNQIIPTIIDKVVLPKFALIAETQWDPMSTSQTCRFVNLVKKMQKDYPTLQANSKNTQAFLKALVGRMKETLDEDVFMPLYPKTVLENRNSGHSVFFHRQSWTCIKLLGNILSWSGFVSMKVLMGLALDGLLNRYILLGLQTAPFSSETLQKCQAIVSTFPKQWFEDLEDDKTIPQLSNLCRFLVYAAQLVDKACSSATELQKRDLRDQMKQISKLLVNIHSLDNAMKLSDMYSLAK